MCGAVCVIICVPLIPLLDVVLCYVGRVMWCALPGRLLGRSQRVRVDRQLSEEVRVTSGVPHGNVLGPLLFLGNVNDICRNTECNIWLFTYDISSTISAPIPEYTSCIYHHVISLRHTVVAKHRLTALFLRPQI